MKRLRIGIIGQGRSGYDIHVKSLKRTKMKERFEVAAVTDLIPERCNGTAAEYPGCKIYPSYKEMLKDSSLDLIVNASFSHQHVPISLEIIEAGFHGLCEKPLAASVAEVDKIAAKIKESGKVFAVFQEARFDPTFRKMLDVCNSGILGRIVMARFTRNNSSRRWDWQTLREMNGGALLNTGSHSLDQALQLFHGEPERIFCSMDKVNSLGDAEDHVKLIFSSSGQPTIDFEVSSCAPYSPPRFQVYGELGGLSAEPGHIEWKFYLTEEAADIKLIREPLPERSFCREKLDWYEYKWADAGTHDTTYLTEQLYLNLYDVIRNGAKLEVTLEDVRRQIAIMEECFKQNRHLLHFVP